MSLELVIALCALLFTFYQAWLSRHHNRLSVQPHLQWNHEGTWTNEGFNYRLVIQNYGLGPARIKKVELFLNGEPFSNSVPDPIRRMVEKAYSGVVHIKIATTNFPAKNYVLKAQSEYPLVTMSFPGLKEDDKETTDKLNAVELAGRFTYESFYGEEWILDSRR